MAAAAQVVGIGVARVNVYLPEELARAARPARLNLSKLLQEALRDRLAADRLDAWLDRLEDGRIQADGGSHLG
ncbi:MAG: type II toxin-antitoxin system CcdA family antitoxin [Candidatus Dormibacteria bacterium]